jgi:hypothetical protein
MANDVRFTIRPLATGLIYVLQVRQSCAASIAQSWLKSKGIETEFKLQGWWYEASWPDSPAAQAIAPQLQARARGEQP